MLCSSKSLGLAAFVAVLALAGRARATLIAAEDFSYAAGTNIQGQNGGTGWAGPWITGQPGAWTADVAIANAPNVNAMGGSMKYNVVDSRVFRAIDVGPGSAAAAAGVVQNHNALYFGAVDGIGKAGTTVWVAMLVSGGDAVSGHETQHHIYDGARTDAASLALGDQNKDGECVAMFRGGNVGQWGFERTCTHSNCGGAPTAGYFSKVDFGGTHWSVVRYAFKANTTEMTIWIDPAPGMVDPPDASALTVTPFGGGNATQVTPVPALYFNTIAVNGNGSKGFSVDEIRIGTTFADVSGGAVSGSSSSSGASSGSTSSSSSAGSGSGPSSTASASSSSSSGGPGAGGSGSASSGGQGGNGGGSSSGPGSTGGCGCQIPGSDSAMGAAIAAIALALGAMGARRRARAAR